MGLNIPLAPELTDVSIQPPSYLVTHVEKGTSTNARTIAPQEPLEAEDDGAGGAYKILLKVVPTELGGTGSAELPEALRNLLGTPSAGTLLLYDGNAWVPLPPGAEGQSLTVTAGGIVWSHASVSIPQTASIITALDEPNLPNAALLVPAENSGLMIEIANGKASLDTDDTIARTDRPTTFKQPLKVQEVLSAQELDLGSEPHKATILVEDLSDVREYMIPECGSSAAFVMTRGPQLIEDPKTFQNLAINGLNMGTGIHEQTFPDATDTLVNLSSKQTLFNKSFSGAKFQNTNAIILQESDFDYEIDWLPLQANRRYCFTDCNADGDIAIKDGAPSSGSVAYGDGNLIKFTEPGTMGLPLVSHEKSYPVFEPLKEAGGGTGQIEYAPGDILVADESGKLIKLPKGKVGEVLTATNTGIAWAMPNTKGENG
jgi:hypothetical protein